MHNEKKIKIPSNKIEIFVFILLLKNTITGKQKRVIHIKLKVLKPEIRTNCKYSSNHDQL